MRRHVERVKENLYTTLAWKSEGKSPLGKPRVNVVICDRSDRIKALETELDSTGS
jgi:hypothetical protein